MAESLLIHHRSTCRLIPCLAVCTVVVGWFFLAVWLAQAGVFVHWRGLGPLSAVQFAIFAPVVLFWLLWVSLPGFRHFIEGLNLTTLVALQTMRILALSHLVSWGYGLMAGGFAIPVATGNLLVSLLALVTISVGSRNMHRCWRWVLALSVLGLAEFAMTIGLAVAGFFTQPTLLDPPVAAGGYVSFKTLPLSLFPTFAIPFFTLVHFATLLALFGRQARYRAGARHR